jgi:hypothetical protein
VAGGNFPPGGPVAVDDTVSVAVGSPQLSVAINVLTNDGGAVTGAGSITIPTLPQNGTVAVNQNTGVITYTFPVTKVVGTETFTYVTRNAAGTRSNTATVTVITTP